MHDLLQWIVRQGWSAEEVKGARAIEVAPGEVGQSQVQFNANLATASDGLLAPPGFSTRALSVSCSHTNAGLRAIQNGCKSKHQDLVNIGGCLSVAGIVDKSPGFEMPLKEGMEWLVFRSVVDLNVPGFASMMQESGNASHGVERTQTKVQTLLQIWSKAKQNIAMFNDPKWDDITRVIEYTRPLLQDQVRDMCTFVEACRDFEPTTHPSIHPAIHPPTLHLFHPSIHLATHPSMCHPSLYAWHPSSIHLLLASPSRTCDLA